jgi:hypothetical protein
MNFLENTRVSTWSVKLMILILCINTVYNGISLKMLLVCWPLTVRFINENVYSHGRVKISDVLSRLLHEFIGLTPAFNLTIFSCKVNIFCC